MIDVLANLSVVIISQYIRVPSHHTVHLERVIYQLYLNKAGGGIISRCQAEVHWKGSRGREGGFSTGKLTHFIFFG